MPSELAMEDGGALGNAISKKEEWKAEKAKRPMGARLPRLTKIESSAPFPTDIPTG